MGSQRGQSTRHERSTLSARPGLRLLPALLLAAIAIAADHPANRSHWAPAATSRPLDASDFCAGDPDTAAHAVWQQRTISPAHAPEDYWTYSRWESGSSIGKAHSIALVSLHSGTAAGLDQVRSQSQLIDLERDESIPTGAAYTWSCLGSSDAASLWRAVSDGPTEVGALEFKEAWVIRFEAEPPHRVERSSDPERGTTE